MNVIAVETAVSMLAFVQNSFKIMINYFIHTVKFIDNVETTVKNTSKYETAESIAEKNHF